MVGRTLAPQGPPSGAVLRQARTENFTVASLLLPRATREHLLSVYGFARLVDDIGDEAPGDRLALLTWVEGELDDISAGRPPRHPLMVTLGRTIRELDLPTDPFRRLIEANRKDQTVTRYATYDELLAYCDLSANPVGHLVLRVFGVDTPTNHRLSDAVCTGLQLTEHWQDVAEDFARGRVYLPHEDLVRFGCTEDELGASTASPALRQLLAFEVERTRDLLHRGSPLVRSVRGRTRVALAGFVGGGHAALDAMERVGYDVLAFRPQPTRVGRLRRTIVELTGVPGRVPQ